MDYHKEQPSMRFKSSGGLLGAAAALLVVALLAGVFVTVAVNQRRPGTPAGTGTPTAPTNQWEKVGALSDQAVAPLLAPSDPRVVYEAGGAQAAPGGIVLRRSDDGGATWRNLAIPPSGLGDVGALSIHLNPADARGAILTVTRDLPDAQMGSCPTVPPNYQASLAGGNQFALPLSGRGGCHLQYYSGDGGEHWIEMKLPLRGNLSQDANSASDLDLLQGQGSRLYTAIHYVGQMGVTRVVTSADGGATWQFADNGLYDQSRAICWYQPTTAGATVFATTAPQDCYGLIPAQLETLWRSDDAGAHWARVGDLPRDSTAVIALATASQPILYARRYSPLGASSVADLFASGDGGHTWQAAPASGVGAGASLGLATTRLADGTLVQAFLATSGSGAPATPGGSGSGTTRRTPPPSAFYAWKFDEKAWRQVAPPVDGAQQPAYLLAAAGADGHTTLWLVAQGTSSSGALAYDLYRTSI